MRGYERGVRVYEYNEYDSYESYVSYEGCKGYEDCEDLDYEYYGGWQCGMGKVQMAW